MELAWERVDVNIQKERMEASVRWIVDPPQVEIRMKRWFRFGMVARICLRRSMRLDDVSYMLAWRLANGEKGVEPSPL